MPHESVVGACRILRRFAERGFTASAAILFLGWIGGCGGSTAISQPQADAQAPGVDAPLGSGGAAGAGSDAAAAGSGGSGAGGVTGGGVTASGGIARTGGSTGTGGATPPGGTIGAGGFKQPNGGSIGTGGATPTGGTIGAGGVKPPNGGSIGAGGATPTGGTIGAGGVKPPNGGTIGAGGVKPPNGGTMGAGGAKPPNGGTIGGGGATGAGGAGGTGGVTCTGSVCPPADAGCEGGGCSRDAGTSDAFSGSCSQVTTEAECDGRGDCHSVFVDPGTCGCAAAGCCAHFSRCADGGRANCSGPATCLAPQPFCEAPYVLSYVSNCFEGCVRQSECASADAGIASSACPKTPPAPSSSCSNAYVTCFYDNCPGTGRTLAICDGDTYTWAVQTAVCGTVTCSAGASGSSNHTCPSGQMCLIAGHNTVVASCINNDCGQGLVSPECTLFPSGCAVNYSPTDGVTFDCVTYTCPPYCV